MMRAKSSMVAAYCMALRARSNSGIPLRIETREMADGGLGDRQAGAVDAKVVAAVNQPGHAVHQDAIAFRRRDVEDDVPARAFFIFGPVVVRDHDFAIARIAADGDESAAVLGHRPRHAAKG